MCVCIRIPFDRFHYVFDLMVFGFFGLVGQPSKCSLDSNSVNYYQQRRSKHGFSDSAMWKFLRPGVYQCFPVTCMPCHKRNITYLSDVELVSLCLCLGTTVAVFQLFLERQIAVFTKLHNKPISPNYLHLHSNDWGQSYHSKPVWASVCHACDQRGTLRERYLLSRGQRRCFHSSSADTLRENKLPWKIDILSQWVQWLLVPVKRKMFPKKFAVFETSLQSKKVTYRNSRQQQMWIYRYMRRIICWKSWARLNLPEHKLPEDDSSEKKGCPRGSWRYPSPLWRTRWWRSWRYPITP